MERRLGESFDDYKKRRMIDKKATNFWLRGRPVHISRVPIERMVGPGGKVSTIYASNTYRKGDAK